VTRDFTLEAYAKLLDAMSGYNVVTVEQFLRGCKEPFIVLRHDVDKHPERAVRMARLENAKGIRATYYFRWMGGFPEKEILEVIGFGHEAGYHYENLSELDGDKVKALADFVEKLADMRRLTPVNTVAMHGIPLSRVRNADMLVGVDLAKYGLLGEPYISPEFAELAYMTDIGRRWSSTAATTSATKGKPIEEKIKDTDAFIRLNFETANL